MGQDPEQLRADIAQTRHELDSDLGRVSQQMAVTCGIVGACHEIKF